MTNELQYRCRDVVKKISMCNIFQRSIRKQGFPVNLEEAWTLGRRMNPFKLQGSFFTPSKEDYFNVVGFREIYEIMSRSITDIHVIYVIVRTA